MTRRSFRWWLMAVCALVGGLVWAVPQLCAQTAEGGHAARQVFTLVHAAILGVVEGVTEYLPISSTGHLLITSAFLGISENKAASDAYAICIQAGAILAVLFLYFGRVKSMFAGLLGRDKQGARMLVNLIAAFVPAVVLALIGEKFIKSQLLGVWPVVSAWFVGGFLILAVAARRRGIDAQSGSVLETLSPKQAFVIGAAQCIAMWPGVSRSLATILGGLCVGLSMAAAVEFSFLLGLLTLGAATVFEGLKEGSTIIATFGWLNPLIGIITAFLAAVISVKWMVGYLEKRGLAIFGYYRIAVAVVVGVMLFLKIV